MRKKKKKGHISDRGTQLWLNDNFWARKIEEKRKEKMRKNENK